METGRGRGAVESGLCSRYSPLARLEDHDRDLAALRVAPEEFVSRVERNELRPEPVALLLAGHPGAHLANLRADRAVVSGLASRL